MSDPVEPLLVDLVAWIGRDGRSYLDVMEAWRTSCPRLPVWEEANVRGFVTRLVGAHGDAMVRVTPAGRALLAARDAASSSRVVT